MNDDAILQPVEGADHRTLAGIQIDVLIQFDDGFDTIERLGVPTEHTR